MTEQGYDNSPPPAGRSPLISSEVRLRDWLDTFESRLEAVAVAYNQASFNKYLGQPVADLDSYDVAFTALLGDPAHQATVRHWSVQAQDPTLRRRLELLQRAFLEAATTRHPAISHLRNAINDRLINFKPALDHGILTRGDITEILRAHPDRLYREQVYRQALSPLARELEPQVRELMRERNEQARQLGYTAYPDLHLALLGLDRAGLWSLFDQLEELTGPAYRKFLDTSRREYFLERVEPWDLLWLADRRAGLPDEPFKGEAGLARVKALLAALGHDAALLPVQVVRREIPFGGLCFAVRVPDDIRIISSPKDGFMFFRTLVHEFGHALHAAFVRQPSYILKREWGPFNEGMAELLAYFTHYDEWLERNSGLDRAAITRYKQESAYRRILRIRNMMAQARFEIEAYDNLGADLDRLHAEQEARYLLLPLNLTPRWAAVSFPTTHPIYRQNYVLADLIAAQTHAALTHRFGSFFDLAAPDRAEVFNYIRRHHYAPGALVEWRDKVQQATGQSLSVDALVEELNL